MYPAMLEIDIKALGPIREIRDFSISYYAI
jgi:hypothetical protein